MSREIFVCFTALYIGNSETESREHILTKLEGKRKLKLRGSCKYTYINYVRTSTNFFKKLFK